MLGKNIKFKNFDLKKKNFNKKKKIFSIYKNLIKEKNEVILSLDKRYKDSFSKKKVKKLEKININSLELTNDVENKDNDDDPFGFFDSD